MPLTQTLLGIGALARLAQVRRETIHDAVRRGELRARCSTCGRDPRILTGACPHRYQTRTGRSKATRLVFRAEDAARYARFGPYPAAQAAGRRTWAAYQARLTRESVPAVPEEPEHVLTPV